MSKIKEYSSMEAGLAELSKKYLVVHDVTTKDGYTQCKKDAKEVGKYRIELESKRKEIKGPALQKCKDIDEEAKRIQLEIAKIEDPLKLAYKTVDEEVKKEKEKFIAAIESEIETIRSYTSRSIDASPSEISEYIEIVDAVDCTKGFYGLTKEALIARNETLDYLSSALKRAIQQEIDEKVREDQEKELQELRKIKSEQEEKERELERQRIEIEHEKQLQEQSKQAEQDKIEADKQVKIDADNAETQRLADVKQAEGEATQREIDRQAQVKKDEEEAQRKLEANKKHVGKICGQAKDSLMKNKSINEKLATEIVKMIAKGQIDNISINY